jgi:hypothetical protein
MVQPLADYKSEQGASINTGEDISGSNHYYTSAGWQGVSLDNE